ncbi:MAG: hypothetical protein MMC33_007311 [Icmadophila ericetorum]|nr:hypothetical protein [Icmadophila ericetorum]
MLTGIPPISPGEAHDLWYPSVARHFYTFPTANTATNQDHPARHAQQYRNAHPHEPPPKSMLSELRKNERAIEEKKAAIRRFGAGWLKPPGINKTLQGMDDDRAEREEQEAVQMREQAMMEAQAAAEAQAEAEAQAAAEMEVEEDGEGVEMRDLDEDIPEADNDNWEELDDDDVGINPVQVGNADGDDEIDEPYDEVDEDGARDLDADVPEAGSYQHTDTDVEDESDMESIGQSALQAAGVPTGRGFMDRSAFGTGSPIIQTRSMGRRSGNFGGHRGR